MTMSMRAVVFGAALALFAASPVAAQDVSLGYQFQHLSGGGEGEDLPAGFNIDASAPIGGGNLSVFGQFDWSRKSESESFEGDEATASLTLATYGGGIRWSSVSNPKVTPFVQGLIGAAHNTTSVSCEVAGVDLCDDFDDSGTDLVIQFGGGVAVPLNASTSIVGQFDYRRLFTEDEGTNSIRFVGGIRIKL